MPEKITWSVTAPPLHWNVLNSDGGGAERTVKTFTCLCRTIILCLESWNSSVSNWAAECSTPVSRLKASRRWRLMEETDLQQLPQQQQQQHLLLWKVLRASEVDSSHFLFYFFFIFTWGLIGGKIVSRNIICTRGDCPAASRSEETNKSSFCGHGGGQHWVLCWVFFVFAVIISSLPHLTLTGHQMLTSSRQTSAQSSETNKFKLIGMKGLCSNWSTVDFSHNKLQWYCGISKK